MKIIYNEKKLKKFHDNKLNTCPECGSKNIDENIYTPSIDNPELSVIYQFCDDCDWIGEDTDIFERIEND